MIISVLVLFSVAKHNFGPIIFLVALYTEFIADTENSIRCPETKWQSKQRAITYLCFIHISNRVFTNNTQFESRLVWTIRNDYVFATWIDAQPTNWNNDNALDDVDLGQYSVDCYSPIAVHTSCTLLNLFYYQCARGRRSPSSTTETEWRRKKWELLILLHILI